MRLLHTADWHLGKTLRQVRRDDEAQALLQEVLEIARSERVDCLLLAGDLFDSAMPPPEAERLAYEFFRELAAHRIRAVVIAGNHDHPRRLGAAGRILELVGVHALGEPCLGDEGRNAVTVPARDGDEAATVVMLPWVREGHLRSGEDLMRGTGASSYADGMRAVMQRLARLARPHTANVLLAHLLVDGAVIGGEAAGERPLHITQTYAVPPQALPQGFHYIALGHVHRPQRVTGGPTAAYAGSIMQLDFGEEGQRKQVVLVEIDPRSHATRLEEIPLSRVKQLRTLGSRERPLPLEELEKVAAADGAGGDYLRVFVRVDGPAPGLAAQVRQLLPQAVDVLPVAVGKGDGEEQPSLRRLSPPDLLRLYHRRRYGCDPDAEVMELFCELWEEAAHEAP